MALSSLFVLMTQHSLEYPNFYEKLYALLEPSIFMAKHRAKFFQVIAKIFMFPSLYWFAMWTICSVLRDCSLCLKGFGLEFLT